MSGSPTAIDEKFAARDNRKQQGPLGLAQKSSEFQILIQSVSHLDLVHPAGHTSEQGDVDMQDLDVTKPLDNI